VTRHIYRVVHLLAVFLLAACAVPVDRAPRPRVESEPPAAAVQATPIVPEDRAASGLPPTPVPPSEGLLPFRSQPPAAPRQSVFGVNSHVASRYPNFGTLDQPVSVVQQLGAGWAREDVQWSRVERLPGAFDWAWHDRVFGAYRGAGINVIGVIGGPAAGWATATADDPSDRVSFYAPDPDRYAIFAGQVAARYKGIVKVWEIWNEPENAAFWQPAPDPASYARMLIKASAAIKAVDPEMIVLNGGLVPYDPTFLNALAAHGAWSAFDVISAHPYVDPFTPEAAQIDLVGIGNVRQLAARYGSKPIWVTEYGWGTGPCERDPAGRTDEQQQANYLVRGAALLRSAGAERVLWYNLKDRQQPCYGLLRGGTGDEDYTSLKPSATALRVLGEQIGGATPLGGQDVMPRQEALGFEDAAGWGAPYPLDKPRLDITTAQVHSGQAAGRITYRFDAGGNDYIAFPRTGATPLPADTTRIGLWVYGDGSGHIVDLRLADEQGETLQYRLGFIGPPGWQFLSTPITGEVEPGNRITAGNGRLDGALRVHELVIDDYPNGSGGSGVIYVDELTAFQGPEVYAQRFSAGNDIVDVVWSPAEHTLPFPIQTAEVTVVSRDGATQTLPAAKGYVTLTVGPAPIYVRRREAAAP
jgi:hypothetical protein